MWSRAPGARPADQPGSAPGQEASGLMACLSALSQRAPPAPPVPGEAAHGKLCGLGSACAWSHHSPTPLRRRQSPPARRIWPGMMPSRSRAGPSSTAVHDPCVTPVGSSSPTRGPADAAEPHGPRLAAPGGRFAMRTLPRLGLGVATVRQGLRARARRLGPAPPAGRPTPGTRGSVPTWAVWARQCAATEATRLARDRLRTRGLTEQGAPAAGAAPPVPGRMPAPAHVPCARRPHPAAPAAGGSVQERCPAAQRAGGHERRGQATRARVEP
jgi:hypothetical protein